MYANAHPTQELSVASSSSHHDDTEGCPVCGGPIQAVERRGPNDVSVSPCGHDITDAQAVSLATTRQRRVATDGGQPQTKRYEVGITAFTHVTVEASSEEDAREQALDKVHVGECDIDEVRPNELSTDGGQAVQGGEHETLMGVELSDIDAAHDALEQYYAHCTEAGVNYAENGRCLVVITENATFQDAAKFRQTPALDITCVRALDLADEEDDLDLRLKVEIREVTA